MNDNMKFLMAAVVSALLMACPEPGPATDGGTGGGSATVGGGAGATGGGTATTGGGTATGGGTGTGGGAPQRDLDVVLVRLNSDGTPDSTFGDGGVARIDFGQATGASRDNLYSMDKDSNGNLVLFGATKSATGTDADRFVARVTPAGVLDSTFATNGLYRQGFGTLNDSARHGQVLPDGKILASGYTSQPTGALTADGGAQSANRIVLIRLNSDGTPDTTFGDAGVVNSAKFIPADVSNEWGMAEAYAAVRQSTGKYVTGGYGRAAPSGKVDLVSFRYEEDGADDTTWGTDGGVVFDLIGGDERARHTVALGDDRIVHVGSGVELGSNIDAMVMVLTANGGLDNTFNGQGYKMFSFDRADEAFFGAAVGPGGTSLAAVGYRVGTGAENDDAVLLVMPVTGSTPAEFAQAVPLSAAEHDRFFGVAWDGAKIVAVGFVRDGADTKFAAARFDTAGVLDNTFGTNGIVTIDVTPAGGTEEVARWVVVQTDGKIVIGGHAEH